jgi:hypothetical protein
MADRVFAGDEGGEFGGLPVRVQSDAVMKSKATTRLVDAEL